MGLVQPKYTEFKLKRVQTTWFLNLPLDEYIDNSKSTKFEFRIQDQLKHD
jgi:hypothetical protein